ncbi:hypothetical protein BFJ67_g17911 [Fusarium oxysporum f. sp. cepae]|nr:hypothetical protein BFJ67_g17911 [Fusarium oxysporum f. sp. cepae]
MSSQPLLQSLLNFRSGSVTALSITVLAVIVAFSLLNRLTIIVCVDSLVTRQTDRSITPGRPPPIGL